MQTQDAPAEIVFKFWPWLEANKNRLIIGGVVALALFVVWLFISSQQREHAIAAGQAYTEFQLNQPPTTTAKQVADGYLQIAVKYAGTETADRAWLQGALTLFEAGNYADAQKQFGDLASRRSGSAIATLAQLGLAASLEAQNKLDEALNAYRAAANAASGSAEAIAAKFSQGRILELQGKLTEAMAVYQEVARSQLAGSLASEAGQRMALMQAKLPATKPAAKS